MGPGNLPGTWEPRRHRVFKILRNHQMMEYSVDMGKASNFDVEQAFIIGGEVIRNAQGERERVETWETVGSMNGLLDDVHAAGATVSIYEPDTAEQVLSRYYDKREQRVKRNKRQSVFGPYLRKERN